MQQSPAWHINLLPHQPGNNPDTEREEKEKREDEEEEKIWRQKERAEGIERDGLEGIMDGGKKGKDGGRGQTRKRKLEKRGQDVG